MAKLASPKAKAKAPVKGVATSKAKPAKAGKGLAKPKAEPKIKHKVGDEVVFNGYAKESENPIFEKDDRLTIVAVRTDDDKNVVLSAVKSEDYEAYNEDENSVTGDEVYASEVSKAPKLPDDPYAISLKDDEALTAFIEETGDGDPLAAAVAATEAIANNTFMLGGCLAELYSGQKFRSYDPKKFADDEQDGKTIVRSGWDKFCQTNFDMNGRKAESYISIYRAFNRLGNVVDLDEISTDRKIGWVKLGAMAAVVDENNVKDLIEKARSSNVEDFKSTIRTDYVHGAGEVGSSGPKVKRTTVKVVFYEDSGEQVKQVVDIVGKMLNTQDLGTIYEYIIVDWAHNSLEEAQVAKIDKARQTALKSLKKAGVDITERQAAFDQLTAMIEGGDEGEDAEGEEEDEAA